jgi:hypothetical protein
MDLLRTSGKANEFRGMRRVCVAGATAILLLGAGSAGAADPSSLVATGRTDTKLYLQWQANGGTLFTVDYLDPSYFGGAQPTCGDFPMHNNILETSGDAVVVEGLQPDTWYQIHVHALDANHLVASNPTNIIIVKTRPAGSGFEALAPGSPDYVLCGSGNDGGGGGDDEEGCAHVTFALLPGSEPLTHLTVTFIDPPTGTILGTTSVPIGESLSAEAASYHLRLSAPSGYVVTPKQRGVNLACGDDVAVRVKIQPEPPRR